MEHHPAREQHREQRQHDREQGESGQLQAHAGEEAQRERRGQPDGERAARRRRGRARSRQEPVADAPDRLEAQRIRRVVLDLRAEPANVHGDGAGVDARLRSPRRDS